jgi:cellulose biosynthesis protein BcsQ
MTNIIPGEGSNHSILCFAVKGGVGKTLLSTNLLAAALHSGHDAVGLDFDEQRSFATWAETRARRSIRPEARIIPLRLRDWDRAMITARRHAVAVVDLPPGIAASEMHIITDLARRVRLVLVPVRPNAASVLPIVRFGEVLTKAGADPYFVLNEVPPRGGETAEARAYLARYGRLCPVEIPQRVDFQRAFGAGMAAADIPRMAGATAMSQLWGFVAERLALHQEAAA